MLLQNNNYQYTNPMKLLGGSQAPGALRVAWNCDGRIRNIWAAEWGGFDKHNGIPNGSTQPASWIMPPLAGGMASYTNIRSAGVLDANLQMGKALSAALLGSGTFGDIAMSLITSMGSNIIGSGEITLSLKGAMAMAADLEGQGDVTASLGLIVWCLASLTGAGYATDSTLMGTARMEASITSEGELLTINNAARAVWQALIADYLVSGTMGNALATASVGGIDLGALANAVRAEMDANSTKLARIQDKSVVATKQDVINASI